MPKLWKIALGLVAVGSLVLGGRWVGGKKRTIPPVRIAVIDGDRLKKAEPYQALMKLLEESAAAMGNEFGAQRRSIEELDKKVRDPKLTAKKRAEYKKQLDRELSQFDAAVRKRRDQIQNQIYKLQNTIDEAQMKIIKRLAGDYHINLILNTNTAWGCVTVFYATEQLDLTEEVMALLNKKMKGLDFTLTPEK